MCCRSFPHCATSPSPSPILTCSRSIPSTDPWCSKPEHLPMLFRQNKGPQKTEQQSSPTPRPKEDMTSPQPYHNVPVTPRGRRPKGGKYCTPQTLRLHPLPPQISAQHQPARSGLISRARPVKLGSGGGSSQSRNKSNHGPVS